MGRNAKNQNLYILCSGTVDDIKRNSCQESPKTGSNTLFLFSRNLVGIGMNMTMTLNPNGIGHGATNLNPQPGEIFLAFRASSEVRFCRKISA